MRQLPDNAGLRERKKARTRTAVQQHAMRLFKEQGYAATTVDQIAAAAEISPSTFFRYFPTKEDVVLTDEYDPLLVEAFRAQPPDVSPIKALRAAMHSVFGAMSEQEMEAEHERAQLMNDTPELRVAYIDQLRRVVAMIAELIAERSGRDADELVVRAFAGALIGVGLAVNLENARRFSDYFREFDQALELLGKGFPL